MAMSAVKQPGEQGGQIRPSRRGRAWRRVLSEGKQGGTLAWAPDARAAELPEGVGERRRI